MPEMPGCMPSAMPLLKPLSYRSSLFQKHSIVLSPFWLDVFALFKRSDRIQNPQASVIDAHSLRPHLDISIQVNYPENSIGHYDLLNGKSITTSALYLSQSPSLTNCSANANGITNGGRCRWSTVFITSSLCFSKSIFALNAITLIITYRSYFLDNKPAFAFRPPLL